MKRKIFIWIIAVVWVLICRLYWQSYDLYSSERLNCVIASNVPLIIGGMINLFIPKLGLALFIADTRKKTSLKLVRLNGFLVCLLTYQSILSAYRVYSIGNLMH